MVFYVTVREYFGKYAAYSPTTQTFPPLCGERQESGPFSKIRSCLLACLVPEHKSDWPWDNRQSHMSLSNSAQSLGIIATRQCTADRGERQDKQFLKIRS